MDDATALGDGPEVDDVLNEDELADGATEGGESGDPEGEPDDKPDDTIEIEKDGIKFRIPAALKDEFMLRPDYTRKTQEVADQRKALDAQITEARTASDEEINVRAGLVAVNAALQQYQGADWQALHVQDPAFAQQHFMTFMQLRDQQTGLTEELKGAQTRRAEASQRVTAERISQRTAEVVEAIPDWSQAKAEALMDFGEKRLNLSKAYMKQFDGSGEHDATFIRLINALFESAKPKSDKPRSVINDPKPATTIRGGSAPRKALDDRQSADDWIKSRNAQVARRP